jgi:hypothetical protein
VVLRTIMPRLNGAYIIEGLIAGAALTSGGLGWVLLELGSRPQPAGKGASPSALRGVQQARCGESSITAGGLGERMTAMSYLTSRNLPPSSPALPCCSRWASRSSSGRCS